VDHGWHLERREALTAMVGDLGPGIGLPLSIDRRVERGLAVGARKPSTLQSPIAVGV
jgi:hypothetical protein